MPRHASLCPGAVALLMQLPLAGCNVAAPADPVAQETTLTNTLTSTDTATDTSTETATGIPFEWSLDAQIESLIVVEWNQSGAATGAVEYSFDEGEWHSSPERALVDGIETQLLLGIPYQTDVKIRLVVDGTTSDTVLARTGDLPAAMPVPEYVSGDPDQWWADGNYIFTSINQDEENWSGDHFWKVIMDRQARVVWALLTPVNRWTLWVDLSNDGHYLMWDENTVYDWSSSDPSMIHKMRIDGTIVETYEADGLHHAWDELADGSLVWGAEITNNEEWLRKRNPDGTVQTIWKCSDFEQEQLGHTASNCHSNSWWWHEESDTYLVCFPSSAGAVRDTVLHIDAAGTTLSAWGQLSDWTFEDEATTFDYQHGVTFTEDGNLLLSTQLTAANPYYRNNYDTLAVREYALDYDNKVLRQVWSFGEDQAIAGKYNGEAHRLANGNTLHNYGTGARLREITPAGDLVWDVKFPGGNTDGGGRLQGRSVFITDLYDFAP